MTKIANVKVGKPHTSPSSPSHVDGVKQGNSVGNMSKEAGFVPEDEVTLATPRRSTGIGAEHREPIDPAMPCLTPA